MSSRFNANHHISSRFPLNTTPAQPRHHVRHDRPSGGVDASCSEVPDIEISASGIPVPELIGFALTCLEKLTCPDSNSSDQKRPLEQTILIVVAEKLPSYMNLKAKLQTALQAHSDNSVRSSQQQHRAEVLRQRVETQEEAIAQHLIATGEEIGLPTELLNKLANLTKSILKRCDT
mgnify:CR=1 FL=1